MVSGASFDSGLVGTAYASTANAMIVMYKGPSKEYIWGLTINSRTDFDWIAFSGTGQIVAGKVGGATLFFIRAVDGDLITS